MSDKKELQGAYNIMILACVLYGISTAFSVYVLFRATYFGKILVIQILCIL